MNGVEYILRARDLLSSVLQNASKAADNARKGVDNINKSTDNMTRQSVGKIQRLTQTLQYLQERQTKAFDDKYIGKYNDAIKKTQSEIERLNGLTDKAKNKAMSLGSSFSRVNGMLSTIGVGVGLYQFANMTKEGVEKAHELHQAEAQLKNTMQNMGTYSESTYEKAVSGAKKMADGIDFSSAQVIGLQSQLRLVGNIGEKEMQRMITASADMATKFKMDLSDAGNTIAKAVNNPEMMRRLGMQLKIDPAAVKHIQDLAKHGQEAAARVELLDIIQRKIGGSAKAAFDANTLAQYNKLIGKIKIKLGDAAIKIQSKLGPALVSLATFFKDVATSVADVVTWLTEHDKIAAALAITLGILTIAINYNRIAATLSAAWSSIAAAATAAWTAITWLFSAALWSTGIPQIVLAIVALIAVIYAVSQMTTGWGKTWSNVIEYMKLGMHLFVAANNVAWLNLKNDFLSGLEVIERGWYRLQKLWNKDAANSGLANLTKQRNDRLIEIAKAQGNTAEIATQMAKMKVWEVKSNGKSFSDIFKSAKSKVVPGIDANALLGSGGEKPGTGGEGNLNPDDKIKSIAGGGSKQTTINISVNKEMIGQITINPITMTQGANEVRDLIMQSLSQLMLSSNKMALE